MKIQLVKTELLHAERTDRHDEAEHHGCTVHQMISTLCCPTIAIKLLNP